MTIADETGWVATSETLGRLVAALKRTTVAAVDTEFVREKTYYPQLCLIQIATRDDVACIDCLAPLGLLAFFGQSSGPVEPFNLALLAQKGSLFITRPTLQTYGAKREAMVAMAKELFDVVQSGVVKININQTYPLKDVSEAHRDLEARKTTGSTVLTI